MKALDFFLSTEWCSNTHMLWCRIGCSDFQLQQTQKIERSMLRISASHSWMSQMFQNNRIYETAEKCLEKSRQSEKFVAFKQKRCKKNVVRFLCRSHLENRSTLMSNHTANRMNLTSSNALVSASKFSSVVSFDKITH